MTTGPDGLAYGITGRAGNCQLLRFEPKTEKYELLDTLVDGDGENCWQVHDLCFAADGTLYACENDNPHRSSYVWEVSDIL